MQILQDTPLPDPGEAALHTDIPIPLPVLSLDFETRSTVNLTKAGAYAYFDDPSTDVLCAAYALGDQEPEVWLRGDPCPPAIVQHVAAGGEIRAWNSQFERLAWTKIMTPDYGWPLPGTEQFWCTAAEAAAMGLPRSLDAAAVALGSPVQKDQEGKALMKRLSAPLRQVPGGKPEWDEDPEKLQRLALYCQQDVRVERAVSPRVRRLPDDERTLFLLDQTINDRGIRIDLPLVNRLYRLIQDEKLRLDAEIHRLTGGQVTGVTKRNALLTWLNERGVEADSLNKAAITALLESPLAGDAREVVELRRAGAKSSTSKLTAMMAATCPDGRSRGLLLYHGANTGRWSGRLIQPHNLPRESPKGNIEAAVDAVYQGAEAVRLAYGDIMALVSMMLRCCLTARPGYDLLSADFVAVEGRVNAWLADEIWKLDAYRAFDAGTGPDLYCLAYSRGYDVPVGEVTKDQRRIGKVMELALGFGGGAVAFQKMGVNFGLLTTDAEAEEIKVAWRSANPATVRYWKVLERAALRAVEEPGRLVQAGRVTFRKSGLHLWCRLPSNRLLCYPYARAEELVTPFGPRMGVTAMSVDSRTRQWTRRSLYGGLWLENITQATARDIMAVAMVRAERAGYPVVLTVHDEVVAEQPVDFGSLTEFCDLLSRPPRFAPDLPLAAEGWRETRYRK
jgi:DNA polymerase